MTKLTALTPAIAEAVINLVTLSVMIPVTVGTVIKLTVICKKCKREYGDRITNNCLDCGTELPPEKGSKSDNIEFFKRLQDELRDRHD